MERPKACACGGLYKKVAGPPPQRDGSRYFKCDRCGARIEQTSNGYEFRDAAPPAPPPAPTPSPPPPSQPPRRPW